MLRRTILAYGLNFYNQIRTFASALFTPLDLPAGKLFQWLTPPLVSPSEVTDISTNAVNALLVDSVALKLASSSAKLYGPNTGLGDGDFFYDCTMRIDDFTANQPLWADGYAPGAAFDGAVYVNQASTSLTRAYLRTSGSIVNANLSVSYTLGVDDVYMSFKRVGTTCTAYMKNLTTGLDDSDSFTSSLQVANPLGNLAFAGYPSGGSPAFRRPQTFHDFRCGTSEANITRHYPMISNSGLLVPNAAASTPALAQAEALTLVVDTGGEASAWGTPQSAFHDFALRGGTVVQAFDFAAESHASGADLGYGSGEFFYKLEVKSISQRTGTLLSQGDIAFLRKGLTLDPTATGFELILRNGFSSTTLPLSATYNTTDRLDITFGRRDIDQLYLAVSNLTTQLSYSATVTNTTDYSVAGGDGFAVGSLRYSNGSEVYSQWSSFELLRLEAGATLGTPLHAWSFHADWQSTVPAEIGVGDLTLVNTSPKQYPAFQEDVGYVGEFSGQTNSYGEAGPTGLGGAGFYYDVRLIPTISQTGRYVLSEGLYNTTDWVAIHFASATLILGFIEGAGAIVMTLAEAIVQGNEVLISIERVGTLGTLTMTNVSTGYSVSKTATKTGVYDLSAYPLNIGRVSLSNQNKSGKYISASCGTSSSNITGRWDFSQPNEAKTEIPDLVGSNDLVLSNVPLTLSTLARTTGPNDVAGLGLLNPAEVGIHSGGIYSHKQANGGNIIEATGALIDTGITTATAGTVYQVNMILDGNTDAATRHYFDNKRDSGNRGGWSLTHSSPSIAVGRIGNTDTAELYISWNDSSLTGFNLVTLQFDSSTGRGDLLVNGTSVANATSTTLIGFNPMISDSVSFPFTFWSRSGGANALAVADVAYMNITIDDAKLVEYDASSVSGTVVTDLSDNGNDGTLNTTVTVSDDPDSIYCGLSPLNKPLFSADGILWSAYDYAKLITHLNTDNVWIKSTTVGSLRIPTDIATTDDLTVENKDKMDEWAG